MEVRLDFFQIPKSMLALVMVWVLLVFGGFLSGLPADVKRAHTFFFRVIDSDAEVCVQVWWSR